MNKTITIYELLGLVKDGKAPKKIQFDNHVYTFYMKDDYINVDNDYDEHLIMDLFARLSTNNALNTIVEIIKDNDKLENIITFYDDDLEEYVAETKINGNKIKEHYGSAFEQMIIDKINETIDHINEIEEKLGKK